jgi:hypothetical protein
MQVPGVPIWEMIGELEFSFLPSEEPVSAMVLCSLMIANGGTSTYNTKHVHPRSLVCIVGLQNHIPVRK